MPDASRQPLLSSIGATGNVLSPGVAPIATGSGFRPKLEASGGGAWTNSATNFPLVQLIRLDNGQTTWLPVDAASPFSDTAFTSTSTALSGWPYGHLLATVFVNGIPSASKVALYAPTYTVTYNGNGSTGGAVPTDSNSYVSGATVTVLGNTGTLTLSGSTFGSWNTASDGSGTSYSSGDTFLMGSANVTLYAHWLTNQSISFTSTAPSNAYVGGPNYVVSATGGGSGNAVTFSIDAAATGVCSSVGSLVTFLATGTCVINANQAGNSTYAAAPQAQQSFTVGPAPTGPSAPTSVVGTAGNAQISVAFTGSSSPGTLGGGAPASIDHYTATCGTQNASGSGSPIVVTGLSNGTSYACTVTATNNVPLSSAASSPSSAVTPYTVPAPPSIGTATPGNASASVSFGPPSNDGGAAIDNYRATCNPGGLATVGSASLILVTGLSNGTTYHCTAAAHNSAGWSAESAISNPVTPSTTTKTQRAYVSAKVGNDANLGANCSISAPCRTFATAVGAVNPGGEVIAIDSGAYGAVTLANSVALIGAPGMYAGISVFSGSGITIATPGVRVVLRGLTISGMGGDYGIRMTDGASLAVENCVLSGMAIAGVSVTGPVPVSVTDTLVRDSSRGVQLLDGPIATISRSRLVGSVTAGLRAHSEASLPSSAVVSESLIAQGQGPGIWATAGVPTDRVNVDVIRSRIENQQGAINSDGILLDGMGLASATLSRSRVTGNAGTGLDICASCTLYSLGNNVVSGNATNVNGTITPLAPW